MFKSFKDIKQFFLEGKSNLEERLLESNSFNILKEKYQSLSKSRKNLIKYSFVFLFLLALFYLPLSYFFSSSSNWSEFKQKRDISLQLLKMRKQISTSSLQLSPERMKSKIKNIVGKYSPSGGTVDQEKTTQTDKEAVYQVDFNIQIENLNVRQIIRLGGDLQNLPQARLISMSMSESEYIKHYNANYKLTGFFSKKDRQKKRRALKRKTTGANKLLEKEKKFLKPKKEPPTKRNRRRKKTDSSWKTKKESKLKRESKQKKSNPNPKKREESPSLKEGIKND